MNQNQCPMYLGIHCNQLTLSIYQKKIHVSATRQQRESGDEMHTRLWALQRSKIHQMARNTLLSINQSINHSRITHLTLSSFLCAYLLAHTAVILPFYLLIHVKAREGIDMSPETLTVVTCGCLEVSRIPALSFWSMKINSTIYWPERRWLVFEIWQMRHRINMRWWPFCRAYYRQGRTF